MSKPCKKCGSTERKHRHCVVCQKNYKAQYYQKNKTLINRTSLQRYHKNKERFRKNGRAFYQRYKAKGIRKVGILLDESDRSKLKEIGSGSMSNALREAIKLLFDKHEV